ncbi:MAG: hypothetical protein PHP54_02290 [Clostridia bacterium]|nr:hypothetical protein [Clostridia bacterium]
MKNKKGISLIVLVITIIVIIILAAAVILTLNNNNPIENANKATYASDKAEVQSALAIYAGNQMANNQGKSPFKAGTTVPITDKDTARDTDGYVTNLKWADLGMGKPGSIETAQINGDTGAITFTATNSKLDESAD